MIVTKIFSVLNTVSTETHMDYAIRDAFISGLQSPNIRHRLLETDRLSVQTAFDQARSLNIAFKNSELFSERRVKDSNRIDPTINCV